RLGCRCSGFTAGRLLLVAVVAARRQHQGERTEHGEPAPAGTGQGGSHGCLLTRVAEMIRAAGRTFYVLSPRESREFRTGGGSAQQPGPAGELEHEPGVGIAGVDVERGEDP